jgi:hypothetical protein
MSSAAVALLTTLAASSMEPWSQNAAQAVPLVLHIGYADGRTVSKLVTARTNSSWTPLFPRSGSWRSPDGLSVTAVGYKYRLERAGVRVEVSVLLGQPFQRELAVASMVVAGSEPARIDRLQELGVAPVTLSVGAFQPSRLYEPQVENQTAALQVEDIEILSSPSPGYRVTVRNHSTRPVLAFHLATYEDQNARTSGRQGHRDGTPAVPVGGTHTFVINADRTRDLIRITGLMFEDGTTEGDAEGVALTRVFYAGRRLQLQRVLALFGSASRSPVVDPASTIASLAAQVDALSVLADPATRQWATRLLPRDGPVASVDAIDGALSAAMREVRDGVIRDLQSAPRDRAQFARWMHAITTLYENWHGRFAELTAP